MKKSFITTALFILPLLMGMAQAQEVSNAGHNRINTVNVLSTGDVCFVQGDEFAVNYQDRSKGLATNFTLNDSVVSLYGSEDYEIVVPNLEYLKVAGSGDVVSNGVLQGEDLAISCTGTGDLVLDLDYDNLFIWQDGAGDMVLKGSCNALMATINGTGDLNLKGLSKSGVILHAMGSGDVNAGDVDDMMLYFAQGSGDVNASKNKSKEMGEMIRFSNEDGQWHFNGQEHFSPKVMDQPTVAFLARESKREWRKVGKGNRKGPDWNGLADRMAELSENLGNLVGSADWETFERDMEEWGRSMEEWGAEMEEWGAEFEEHMNNTIRKDGGYEKGDSERFEQEHPQPQPPHQPSHRSKRVHKSLLLDPNWNGFDAGLNMLVDPSEMDIYTGVNDLMELRPLRSWYFGFNIADVGIAFDYKHTAGLFTGIGLGWNNYSWKNYIQMTVDGNNLVNTLVPVEPGWEVKKSKLGVLYLQAPLMFEVRPYRSMFIDLGVTGGLRLAAWNKIKYENGHKEKVYDKYTLNLFKVDASLRMGGSDWGFFVNYALTPAFRDADAQKAHPLSVGFSLVF